MKNVSSKRQKKLMEILLFLLKILIFAIPLHFILVFPGILFPFQEMVSMNVHFLLNFMGLEAARDGFLLTIAGGNPFVFFISGDCTGWKSVLFLTALIFAVPGVLRKKRFIGLAAGMPLIYAGNIIRILVVVGTQQAFGTSAANLIHDYLWQAGLIALVLVIWISWLVWAGKLEITFLKRFNKLIKPR